MVLLGSATIVVVVATHGGPRTGAVTPQVDRALLARARPDRGCPGQRAIVAPGRGRTTIEYATVTGDCLGFHTVAVAHEDVSRRLAALRKRTDVVAADRRSVDRPADLSDVPRVSTGAGALPYLQDLQVDRVHAMWPKGAQVRVGIMDTGISATEARLRGKVVERAEWNQPLTMSAAGHGTEVAGVVAADGTGDTVDGLAPQAQLIDAQWGYYSADQSEHDPPVHVPYSDGAIIAWLVVHGANVINMSLGTTDRDDVTYAALLFARRFGVVLVASSGNCGSPYRLNFRANGCDFRNQLQYPAGYSDVVLSVAAATVGGGNGKFDRRPAGFSSSTGAIDLAAPGDGIRLTCLDKYLRNVLCTSSGTSFAAPFVAATAALLLARHPDADPAEVAHALYATAACDDFCDQHPGEVGHGYLQPVAAGAYLDAHRPSATEPPLPHGDNSRPGSPTPPSRSLGSTEPPLPRGPGDASATTALAALPPVFIGEWRGHVTETSDQPRDLVVTMSPGSAGSLIGRVRYSNGCVGTWRLTGVSPAPDGYDVEIDEHINSDPHQACVSDSSITVTSSSDRNRLTYKIEDVFIGNAILTRA